MGPNSPIPICPDTLRNAYTHTLGPVQCTHGIIQHIHIYNMTSTRGTTQHDLDHIISIMMIYPSTFPGYNTTRVQ